MASQKKSADVNAFVSNKQKEDKAWREFVYWINGKDARGGKGAQAALAKERANRLIQQYGPKLNGLSGIIGSKSTPRQADRVTPKRSVEPVRGGQTRRGPKGGQTRRVADTRPYRNRPTRTGLNPKKI